VRAALCALWLVLAAALLFLGRQLEAEGRTPLPALEPGSPRFEISGEGFHFELDVAGTPLSEPFEKLQEEVDARLAEIAETVRRDTRRAAWTCYGGAAAALLGFLLAWRSAPQPREAPGKTGA